MHLAGRLDDGLDGLDAECPDELVIQIRRALVEAESRRSVSLERRAETRCGQPVPELGPVRGVVEPRKRESKPVRAESRRECPRVGDPAHRHDLDTFGEEVPTMALCQSVQRHQVAVSLDQHDSAQRGHLTTNCAARPSVNCVAGARGGLWV